MEFYTLNNVFLKQDVVDTFVSAIWTERYAKAGDFNLVVEASPDNVTKLGVGKFLALPSETKEVMIVETHDIKNDLLTVTGNSLVSFLQNRIIRGSQFGAARNLTHTDKPGETMTWLVQNFAISGDYLETEPFGGDIGVGDVLNKIPNLAIHSSDTSGTDIEMLIPYGPLYELLEQIAETYTLGMSMWLESATEGEYQLYFKSYKGLDRTSSQSVNPVVQFSPAMDSLTNISELRSIAGYKTSVYAFPSSSDDFYNGRLADGQQAQAHEPGKESATGFDRRVLMIFCDDLNSGSSPAPNADGPGVDAVYYYLTLRAKDALANNNYIKIVDGEVIPQPGLIYGSNYKLGDIVELKSHSGILQNARITEYIRSQDSSGEKVYPTVSIIE